MKDYLPIFKHARTALIVFALSLLLLLSSIAAVSYFNTAATKELAQKQAALQSTRSEIEVLTNDLQSIETNLADFKHLTRLGLIGEPDREAWMERFNAIHQASGLPPTLRYALAPPAPFTDDPSPAPTDAPPQALRHDLQIELTGIHEGEFLAFADKLAAEWLTPYRIENCDMKRADEEGLAISCTLRLFSLPLPTNSEPAPN
ncbi:MAG: hypothetical protein PHQ60_11825 [Sideroxydans sp.]|nr:hypothetical protein [Sideroxydans sp.]